MRWFKIAVLSLLFLLGLSLLLFESSFGQSFLQNALLKAFARSGIEVESATFTGHFPQEMDLTDVRIKFDDAEIRIDRLHIELSLFPLLQKELLVEKLEAEGVKFDKIPNASSPKNLSLAITVNSFKIADFQWPNWPALNLAGDFQLNREGRAWLNVDVEGPFTMYASAKGFADHFSGKVSGQYKDFSFRSRVLKKQGEPIEFTHALVSGLGFRVQGDLFLDKEKFVSDLELKGKLFDRPLTASAKIDGTWSGGKIMGSAQYVEESWDFQTPFTYAEGLRLENVQIDSPLLHATGQLLWQEGKISGTAASEMNLALAELLLPDHSIGGHLTSSIIFGETIEGSGQAKELTLDSFYAKEASFQGSFKKNLTLELHQAKYKKIEIDSASFTAAKNVDNWLYYLSALGSDAAAELNGLWRAEQIVIEQAVGTYRDFPFNLEAPCFIAWPSEEFSIKPFALQIGGGTLFFSIDKTDFRANLSKVPLGIFLREAKGEIDARAAFQEIKSRANGELSIEVQNGEISTESIQAMGRLEASLNRNRLALKANLDLGNHPIASFDFDLPARAQLWPPEIEFYEENPAAGAFHLHGKIEEIFDFFNFGMHRLQGDIDCDLTLKGSLGKPTLEGGGRIENGYYENYLSGTELTQLFAELTARGDHLYLTSLTAKDAKKKGEFSAKGELLVSVAEQFPFHIGVDFKRLNIVQIDLLSAEAEGNLSIDGNLQSALARGNIEIIESDISIPDRIPRTYPELQVVYKHGRTPPLPSTPPKSLYPLNLALDIRAPEGVFIDGRGLHSEWRGDFHVAGSFATPSVQGKLDLINGEFVFAGRRFKLLEGGISMKGKSYELPTINITAATDEKGISITAHLAGPLNKPQITFQSSPPLPMSGILSYLLFGKSLSEVSGIQALQLASTIAQVAGEGPDILEMTRKALGVDRLEIVLTPKGTEGEETLSLEVGKLVFPGFLVSIRQGADDSSPNIIIEVDLTHGFTFGAESQQQSEQGKFSLKWNLNY